MSCVTGHRVAIFDRGGARHLFSLVDLTSVTWSRALSSPGATTVVLQGSACRDQARVLEQVRLLCRRAEMVVFRGSERVFEGPLEEVDLTGDRATLIAFDVTRYPAYRNLTRDWPSVAGGGPLGMIERAQQIISYELGTDYPMEVGSRDSHRTVMVPAWENVDPPANVLPHLVVYGSETLTTTSSTLASEMTVLEHIQNLADSGLGWTTVGRSWVLWDRAYALGKTRKITDADLRGDARVIYSGAELALISHVSGQRPDGPSISSAPGVTRGVGHAVSPAAAPDFSAVTLIPNGDFETNVAGWSVSSLTAPAAAAAITQSTTWAALGTHSMRVAANPTFAPGGANGYVEVITVSIPVTPGKTYVVDTAVMAREGQKVRLRMNWTGGVDAVSALYGTFPGQGQRVSFVTVAPPGATSAIVALGFSAVKAPSGSTEQAVFWDDVWLYEVPTVEFENFYGPWEALQTQASESSSGPTEQSQSALNSQGERLLVGKYPLPVEVRIPDGASLVLSDTLRANMLVPGVIMPLVAQMNLVPVAQDQLLTKVEVTETATGEQVKVTLVPAGEVATVG